MTKAVLSVAAAGAERDRTHPASLTLFSPTSHLLTLFSLFSSSTTERDPRDNFEPSTQKV
jgi:hypothetical protein